MADYDEANEEIAPVEKEHVKSFNLKKEIWDWIKSLLWAVIIVFIVFQFIIKPVEVDGSSMEPTLHNKDRLIVYQLMYQPKNGDVVILDEEAGLDEALVKRVIAVDGQTIDIDEEGNVLVDGVKIQEDYIKEPIAIENRGDMEYPVTVPEGCIFVMGDNRNHSTDSRFSLIGFVKKDDVVGKVVLRLMPFDQFGLIE